MKQLKICKSRKEKLFEAWLWLVAVVASMVIVATLLAWCGGIIFLIMRWIYA